MPKDVGERITEARESTGLGRKEFAAAIDTVYSTYAGWENGSRGVSFEDCLKVARKTGFNPCYIAFGINPKRSDSDDHIETSARLDRDLLIRCVVLLERMIESEKLSLPPERKAQLLLGFYETAAALPTGQLLTTKLGDFIREAQK